ncbi:MAG: tetratricopeptide repeat protein [Planctomycetes bacterium]|nr:tetratricopeptide repeat protein [Planctomycetota bacterium]
MRLGNLRKYTISHAARLIAIAALAIASQASTAQNRPALVPENVQLQAAAQAAINAGWLNEQERTALRIFHGIWDSRDLLTPQSKAVVALNAWDFKNPVLSSDQVLPELRAQAKLIAGELQEAILILDGANTNWAARIRAQAYEELGEHRKASESVEAPVKRMLSQHIDDAAELTEGVRALVIRARLDGQPARDYRTMMSLFGRAHQQLNRLYWPAKLAEAHLLLDKDHTSEAVTALHETLELNPRCSDAWYTLGQIALSRFDFESANVAADKLLRLNSNHPLASLLLAESRLIQDDPDGALQLITQLTDRLPNLRPAKALYAAALALQYNDEATQDALDEYETLSPGSATAYYVVGKHLSLARQYQASAKMLEEAIRRQPAWPAPQIELGLMELQSGRDAHALSALRKVVELDPFNNRAANSLFLLEELATYKRIESEHFVVRYKQGIDQVMADLMLEPLEEIHARVSKRFGFEPKIKTIIELLPDHERFAVRITGLPGIHTIAACTGPVIAIEVPREGPPSKHQGPFDWARVIGHEYTHTITLGQTQNRIPHWLTEAAAVSMEDAPRTYSTCKLLSKSFHEKQLFNLDEIKWAFVRPKRPSDRALAYAQGHWMVEYMDQRFGNSAIVRLLHLYQEGIREQEAIPRALGVSREQFFADFLVWAEKELTRWGLAAKPTLEELKDQLRMADTKLREALLASKQARLDVIAKTIAEQIGQPSSARSEPFTADKWPTLLRPPVNISEDTLLSWLKKYPDHPDLLQLQLRRQVEAIGGQDKSLIPLLEKYVKARPVDPFSYKRLADIWLHSSSPEKAIPYLEQLDIREEKTPVYALTLARMYRENGEKELALKKATRALQINPYNADNRELAAEIAFESGQLDLVRKHIVALTIIEPDRPRHKKRLIAIDQLIARQSN